MNDEKLRLLKFEAYDPSAHDRAVHAYIHAKYGDDDKPPRPLWFMLFTAGSVSLATLIGYGVYRAAVAFAAGIGWLGGEQ